MNGVYTLGYSLRWSFVYLSARPRATAPHEPKLSFISSRVAVTGSERVELSVLEPGRTSLTLHAHQVVLTREPALAVKGGANLTAAGVSYNYALQTVTIDFGRELPVGDATLSLSFRGTLNDELAGFYRSRYTLRGESRNAAVTQFEATDARRAFPCWDEPAAKAVFELTVTAPADRTVLSNMHAVRVSTSADGRSRTHEFAPSPVMSSYLVAIVVGEFDSVARTPSTRPSARRRSAASRWTSPPRRWTCWRGSTACPSWAPRTTTSRSRTSARARWCVVIARRVRLLRSRPMLRRLLSPFLCRRTSAS
jgi:aminopeptidase N